jgi:predicted transcriptional regulator of viral defense system
MSSTYASVWLDLLSRGVTSFTSDELRLHTGASAGAARAAIARGRAQGWLFSPVRGFYVIVSPEYRARGFVPGEQFIDAAMGHLRARYYVGYLAAAAHHGASHQAAQVYQVMTDRRLADRDIGRLRLRYYQTDTFDVRATQRVDGAHGPWVVAAPETCLLDCVERPDRAGGLGNVITIAHDLQPVIGVGRLVEQAMRRTVAVIRRAGWVLDRANNYPDLAPLRAIADLGTGPATPLDPRSAMPAILDRSWWLAVNTGPEGDA